MSLIVIYSTRQLIPALSYALYDNLIQNMLSDAIRPHLKKSTVTCRGQVPLKLIMCQNDQEHFHYAER